MNSSGHYSKQGRCSFYISPQKHFHLVWLGPEFQRETENDHVSSSINFYLLFISLVLSCSFMVCLLNVLQKFSLSAFMSLGKKQSDKLQILCGFTIVVLLWDALSFPFAYKWQQERDVKMCLTGKGKWRNYKLQPQCMEGKYISNLYVKVRSHSVFNHSLFISWSGLCRHYLEFYYTIYFIILYYIIYSNYSYFS